MYAKIINEETKQCDVGTGTNTKFYESIGMTEMDVEQAYNGQWYVKGYAPAEPAPTKEEQEQARASAYASEIDPLHARKARKTILGEWTEEDEAEYVAKVKELSAEIVARYSYPTDPIFAENNEIISAPNAEITEGE